MHLTYVTDIDGDWAALYFNGTDNGIEQNHSLSMSKTLESLMGHVIESVATFEVDTDEGEADWMGPRGFPYNLSDIPQEERIYYGT